MIHCISVENMRLSDAYTIDNFVPSLELMHRAAMGVYRAVNWMGKTAIVVGSGNNGGDGFALACILKEQGLECRVFTVSQRLSADSAHYAQAAKEAGIATEAFRNGCLDNFDIVVDSLLGTGFQGEVRENFREAIEEINRSNAYVVSVDINSGMNGDTGEGKTAVHSDLTVTIGYVKNGMLTRNAGDYMKKLVYTDIGILLAKEENRILSDEEWLVFCRDHGISSEEGWAVLEGRQYSRCPRWLDMEPV